MHGGKTPGGIALPQTKTGRWSKHLPTRLAARYEEHLHDEQLYELRHEIALLDARLGDLLRRTDAGRPTGTGSRTGIGTDDSNGSTNNNGPRIERQHPGDDPSDEACNDGTWSDGTSSDDTWSDSTWSDDTWGEISKAIELRKKLVDAERKHLRAAEKHIHVSQVLLMVSLLIDIIRRHVRDNDTLGRITADIDREVLVGPAGRA